MIVNHIDVINPGVLYREARTHWKLVRNFKSEWDMLSAV